uniref:Uncharacterized protein n=1 Tax=Dulem virus 59 TaxID=3145770 RepID=A0AAU8B7S4_9VIRU
MILRIVLVISFLILLIKVIDLILERSDK